MKVNHVVRQMIRVRLDIKDLIRAATPEAKEQLEMALRWLDSAERCVARAEKQETRQ